MKRSLILLLLAGATMVSADNRPSCKPVHSSDKTRYKATLTTAAMGYATCKGDSPCKACKNCKYCKRCAKNGLTCGVCKK